MHYIASRLIPEIDIDLMSSPSDNNVHYADLSQPQTTAEPRPIPCEHYTFSIQIK